MQDVPVQADNGMSQFTKTSNTIALCSLANFINAADRVIMPIAIIQMSAQFQWDLHGQGWILSAFSIGYICTMVSTVCFQLSYSLHVCGKTAYNVDVCIQ